MTRNAELGPDGRTLSVRVPIDIGKRGGRKVILAPEDSAVLRSPGIVDSALVKAMARAFRWRKLIESGVYNTIAELAAADKINASYVSRMLRLTLLSPDIVEAILDGEHVPGLTISQVIRPFPLDWRRQRVTG